MRRSHLFYISVTLADSLYPNVPLFNLLQSVFDMSALCANTSTQTVSPCIDSSVNNVLMQTNQDFNQSLLEFIHILERRLIHPLLHDPPELVIDQIEVRAVGGPQIRRDKIWGFALQQFDRFARRCKRYVPMVHCPAETRTCHQRHV